MNQGELEAGGLDTLARFVYSLIDKRAHVLTDESLNQRLAHGFLPGEARQRGGLVVPVGHLTIDVRTDDGGVGAADHPLEIFGNIPLLLCHLAHVCDVDADTNNAFNIIINSAQRCEVHGHLPLLPCPREQWELEVGGVLSAQGLQQDESHGRALDCWHKGLDETLSKHLFFSPARNLCCLVVELIHRALYIDSDDGCIRKVHNAPEVASDAFQLLALNIDFCDILSHANYASDLAIGSDAPGGVDREDSAITFVRVELQLEILDILACQCALEYLVDFLLLVEMNEALNERLPQHAGFIITRDFEKHAVPFDNAASRVDAKDRCVCAVNEAS
mmetsp:Transcript_44394/g.127089  ORF Transcript_44394/g.127089 Transcript_44394/m.127089 type:complete len:333 (-) Transcript_44394:3341-4339(-)